MIIDLVSTIWFESVVVEQCDKMFKYLSGNCLRCLGFLFCLLVILFSFSQNLKSQTWIKFSEFESQQSHESSFEIINIRLNVQFVVLVVQRFQHDTWMLSSDVVDCLSQINRLVTILSPEFKELLGKSKWSTQIFKSWWFDFIKFFQKWFSNSLTSKIIVSSKNNKKCTFQRHHPKIKVSFRKSQIINWELLIHNPF